MSRAPRVADSGDSVDFQSLRRQISESGSHPLDVSHVAAMLELSGITDRRAVSLGYDDVFDLAQALYESLSTDMRWETVLADDGDPWYKRFFQTIRLYLRGLSFAAPMILSSASVLALRFSLWSYVDFSTEIATAIALATFGSFLVTGGFTQAIARRGLFYITQEQWRLARISTARLLLMGVYAIVLTVLLVIIFVAIIPILPWPIVGYTFLYFLPMSFIWLGTGLLYMLDWEPVILVLISFGIGMVYYFFDIRKVPMMYAQAISMWIIAVISFLLAFVLFRRLERRNPKEMEQSHRMRWSQATRSLMPFFIYGVAYFALNFADRVMAWSRPEEFHPYFIWFRGDYELGLDWALWCLFVPMGIVEIYIVGMFRRIQRLGKHVNVANIPAFNRGFQLYHLRTMILVLVSGFASIPGLVWLAKWLFQLGLLYFDPMDNPITRFVFLVGSPSFSIIAAGLQGSLVLFSLNEPWVATRAAGSALLLNIIVGFLASRYVAYWWAVWGLAVGSLVFTGLITVQAMRVLGRLDFHLMRGA